LVSHPAHSFKKNPDWLLSPQRIAINGQIARDLHTAATTQLGSVSGRRIDASTAATWRLLGTCSSHAEPLDEIALAL